MSSAALYRCELRHVRTAPIKRSFTYRTYQWLVDLDDLPRLSGPLRCLARFEARDHFGDPGRTIRANVDRFLSAHGISLAGGRVQMLTNARVFGYVFNPLTVYWCRDSTNAVTCVIAEVHNTYGGRHCYLIQPDDRRPVTKAFYVSPFFPLDGVYRMRLPEPGRQLDITIALHSDAGLPFVARLKGTREPFTSRALLRAAVRHPWVTLAVSFRIRVHGIALYLRGLPITPRPASASTDTSAFRTARTEEEQT